jgi:hypothetical protein
MLVVIYVKFCEIRLYAECHYAECLYAECHYVECCGATQMSKIFKLDYFVVDSRTIWLSTFPLKGVIYS